MRLTGIAAALATILLLASVSAARAHAQLERTNPPANAVLPAAPAMAQLVFNEPVSPLRIELITPDGASIDLVGATIGGATVVVTLPAGLGSGRSVLSWRVASLDGHPVAGSLVFSVGSVTGTVAPPASDLLVAVTLWAGKVALFVALFVGIGGAAFGALVPIPAAARRSSLILSAAGLAVAPLTLAMQGLDALGLPLVALLSADAWRGGFATSYGATTVCAAGAFALALLSLATTSLTASRVLGGMALLAGALSLALSGHASAADPQWLTRPAVFLHLAGILFWIGALLPLWILLRDRSEGSDRALLAFSRIIPFAVGILVVSGFSLAAVQLGWPGPQWFAPYTAILATKLALLCALFGLALWNRFRLTAPALAGNSAARHRLRQSIRAEGVLVLLIVGLVAGWRFTPPPRALAAAVADNTGISAPLFTHIMDASHMATIMMSPGRAGPTQLDIAVTDAEGQPIAPQAVAVSLSLPDRGIEPIRRDAEPGPKGWIVENLVVPVPGTWTLEVEVRLDTYSMTRLVGPLEVP